MGHVMLNELCTFIYVFILFFSVPVMFSCNHREEGSGASVSIPLTKLKDCKHLLFIDLHVISEHFTSCCYETTPISISQFLRDPS